MTQIVPCRMCKGREDVKSPRRYRMNRQTWFGCGTLSCAVDGPRRHTEAEAIAAWNELMQPSAQAAPEPKAEGVRVRAAVRFDDDGNWAVNGTSWGIPGERSAHAILTADIEVRRPVEIPGTVEASDE